MDNQKSDRIQASISSEIEKKVLIWIARRLPARMKPDHLTAIGLIGAFLAGAGYAMSNWGKGYLWLSSFGFIVNWFGDSLDGTLARVRNIQRPKYGFFIDHNVDAITAFIIVTGAGFSPFVTFSVALLVLMAYFMLCIFTYINTYLYGVLKISYSGFGPTELRLSIILINTIFYFVNFKNSSIILLGFSLKIFDIFALVVVFIMMVLYFFYFFTEKKKFGNIDPPQI